MPKYPFHPKTLGTLFIILTLVVACQRGPLLSGEATLEPTQPLPTTAPTARPKATRTPKPVTASTTTTATAEPSPIPEGRTATIVDVQGKVEVREDSGAKFANAVLGQILQPGASIRTDNFGQATLQMTEGTIIHVSRATTFEFTEIGADLNSPKTILNMSFGDVLVILGQALGQSKFEVQTPLGVASVRGSAFTVQFSNNPPPPQLKMTCIETAIACEWGNGVITRELTSFQVLTLTGSSEGQNISQLTITDVAKIKNTLLSIEPPQIVISNVLSILNQTITCFPNAQGTIICPTPTPITATTTITP